MVYVTETGTVYHKKAGCRYLKVSINQISGSSLTHARNDSGQKYSPCESCSRNQKPSGVVYVTSSGNRYHNLATCSGLKRTVKLVKESQLEECMPAAAVDKRQRIMQIREVMTVLFLAVMGWKDWKKKKFHCC